MAETISNTTLKQASVYRTDVLAAAYQLGQSNNISDLARMLGKSPVVLANKLNPDCDSHHLNLGEAVAISELAGDNGILAAWAASRGLLLVARPDGAVCDDELVEQVLLAQSVFGKLMQAIHDARADGVIDKIEQRQIERIGSLVAEQVMGLVFATNTNVRSVPSR
ncbi:phage regulatory CII family protein [Aeromonas jandaei]|uniref:phage regulatory CII family protein n=1 Tax=Aeromonas jandaei TaxID=650 RepID=UPI0039882D16